MPLDAYKITDKGLEWNTGPCPFCDKPVPEDKKMEHLTAKHRLYLLLQVVFGNVLW